MDVEYKIVPEFKNYRVGNDGSVWRHWSGSTRKPTRWKIMRPKVCKTTGYQQVTLCKDGTKHSRYVHRLVLESFVGPCPPGMLCRHFPDGTRTNNNLSNLQWGTHIQNQADRVLHGTDSRGANHPCVKLTEHQVIEIRQSFKPRLVTYKILATRYGVTKWHIADILLRKSWVHI